MVKRIINQLVIAPEPILRASAEAISAYAEAIDQIHTFWRSKPEEPFPYIRAKQTAEVLTKVLKFKQELVFSDTLVPMGKPDDIIGEINEKYNIDELVLVGHEPCFSSLVDALIAGNPDLAMTMKNGGVCCLASDDLHAEHQAALEWLLTPKILGELG